jgi:DNA invertase Pin-like site-specific DNA recombinase
VAGAHLQEPLGSRDELAGTRAQFEREVTGERIRDKIAASKAKGLWMGGLAPLGYDLPGNGTRVLQVSPGEAATVRHIFERYLQIRSVHRLLEELERDGGPFEASHER